MFTHVFTGRNNTDRNSFKTWSDNSERFIYIITFS